MSRHFHVGTRVPSHSVDFEAAFGCCFFRQHASFIYPLAFIFLITTAQARRLFLSCASMLALASGVATDQLRGGALRGVVWRGVAQLPRRGCREAAGVA